MAQAKGKRSNTRLDLKECDKHVMSVLLCCPCCGCVAKILLAHERNSLCKTCVRVVGLEHLAVVCCFPVSRLSLFVRTSGKAHSCDGS
jgi:hypothetical protein